MALGQHTARMHAERGRVLVSEKVEERARDSRGEESLREERRERATGGKSSGAEGKEKETNSRDVTWENSHQPELFHPDTESERRLCEESVPSD